VSPTPLCPQTRDGSLRLKATLERLQRLTSDWTEQMLATYPRPAHQLGQALGVPHHMHEIFTESEIRSSLMFQLSKQATLLLKAARQVAGCGEWDAVVAGTACGKLMAVDAIDPVALQGLQEDVVLLVKNASGDEEVGTAGSRVKGVVLCQELPHLSHLGEWRGGCWMTVAVAV
jgi:phosphoglucan,water dikinase